MAPPLPPVNRRNTSRRQAATAASARQAELVAIEPIQRTRVSDQVANRLRQLIFDGGFERNRPLPSERTLASRLGVSRSSVRDGIRRLEAIGLLAPRHGQGTFARELSVTSVVTPLATALMFNHARQDNLMDVRRILEPAVARVATERATEGEVAELRAILAAQRRKARAGMSTVAEDAAFHAGLARATHNPVLVSLMDTLNKLLLESHVRTLGRPGRAARSLRGHQAVLGALRARDAEGAARAMHAHIDQIDALLRKDRRDRRDQRSSG